MHKELLISNECFTSVGNKKRINFNTLKDFYLDSLISGDSKRNKRVLIKSKPRLAEKRTHRHTADHTLGTTSAVQLH